MGGGALVAGAWLPPGSAAAAAETPADEDGYDLWLRYWRIADSALLASFRRSVTQVVTDEEDDVVLRSATGELVRGLEGLLDQPMAVAREPRTDGAVVVGTADSRVLRPFFAKAQPQPGPEGFVIRSARRARRAGASRPSDR
ncbi:MAG: alpha-glucuronidase family glycosyl hydrolase [Actinomadura sp.]